MHILNKQGNPTLATQRNLFWFVHGPSQKKPLDVCVCVLGGDYDATGG